MEPLWSFQLLGAFRVVQGDRVVDRLETRQAALLLAYLAYHAPAAVSRETLAAFSGPTSRST